MKVGIHLDRYGKVTQSILRYKNVLEFNGYEVLLMDIDEADFWEKVESLDYFIYRYSLNDDQKQIAEKILPVIEKYYGVKVFPDENTRWSYDDKLKEVFLFKQNSFPFVDSWVFFNAENALKWAKHAKYPIVFKLRSGSRSQNVLLVSNYDECKEIITTMFSEGVYSEKLSFPGITSRLDFSIKKWLRGKGVQLKHIAQREETNDFWSLHKNYVMFQKFLPGNTFDTRITIVGDYAFGARRFTRKDDFRASGSNMASFDKSAIDTRMIEIAFRISNEFHFQSMGYDFIYDENNNPKIVEISYTYPNKVIDNADGCWKDDLSYHKNNYFTEYYHLLKLLNKATLSIPSDTLMSSK